MIRRNLLAGLLAGSFALSLIAGEPVAAPRWPEAKARAWQARTGWLVGCNFAPSTAINQLEMWQADTFDPATLERELAWAESLGFNSVRVFLHHLLWDQDSAGFLQRIDQFLAIARRHHIGVVLVPLDGVWDPASFLGPQRAPKPHVHNSGWVQSPGSAILGDPARHDRLQRYIQGVIGRFRADPRIHAWDLFNEADNPNRPAYSAVELTNKAELAVQLLRKVFVWAREIDPVQPLTAGAWIGTWADPAKLSPLEEVCFGNSDVISFHNYSGMDELKQAVENLKRYHRPILCTEYMSRGNGSFFNPNLGYLQSEGVAAFNWGLVAGKTQTIYPWDSWTKTYTAEPAIWFHDIFRADGTPFDPIEVEYIRDVTHRKPAAGH